MRLVAGSGFIGLILSEFGLATEAQREFLRLRRRNAESPWLRAVWLQRSCIRLLIDFLRRSTDRSVCATENRLLEVEGALVVQAAEVFDYVLGDFFRGGFGVLLLQGGDDFSYGFRAVAEFDDFQAGAVEAKGAFGHQEDALRLRFFVEAAAGSEARALGKFRRHEPAFAGMKAPGGGQPGST